MNLSNLGRKQREILRHLVAGDIILHVHDYRDFSTTFTLIDAERNDDYMSLTTKEFMAINDRAVIYEVKAPSSLEILCIEYHLMPHVKEHLQQNYDIWLLES